ncbi:signal peptidase II [bacterium]|nr:signal peptidase II [Pirellulales bacterium]MDC1301773.1 signal peptidase II [bacterium]
MTKVPATGSPSSDSSTGAFRATPITWALFTSVVVLTTAADLITKEVAFKNLGMPGTSPGWTVINNMLWWRTSLNEGALFGLGQGMGWFFITVSVAALIGILFTVSWLRLWHDAILVLSLACITGGILGNLYDRLGIPSLQWHAPLGREGDPVYAVRDWIHFRLDGVIDWPIFNLADSFLVLGAGLLLFLSFFPPAVNSENSSTQNTSTQATAEETPDV